MTRQTAKGLRESQVSNRLSHGHCDPKQMAKKNTALLITSLECPNVSFWNARPIVFGPSDTVVQFQKSLCLTKKDRYTKKKIYIFKKTQYTIVFGMPETYIHMPETYIHTSKKTM